VKSERQVHADVEAICRNNIATGDPTQAETDAAALRCARCGARLGFTNVTTAIAVGGWVRARVDGEERLYCGGECLTRAGWRARSTGETLPVKLHDAAAPALPPPSPAPMEGDTKRVVRMCSRGGCTSRIQIDQTKLADGTWSPNAEKLIEHAGWLQGGKYCGHACAAFVSRIPERPPVEAVTTPIIPGPPRAKPVPVREVPRAPASLAREIPEAKASR